MSDHNRKYKKIVRVDDDADARIRAYAAEHSLSASEAAIALVMGTALIAPPAQSAALPDDLTDAIARRAAAKGATADETIAAVLRVGLKRLEAVDRYAASKK